jgi:hypothetical protein
MASWARSALAAVTLAALVGAGCQAGAKKAARQEEMLSAAGFRTIPADTPERVDALHRLTPGRVTPVLRGERTYYVYPDPKTCGCLYVGTADEYDSYKKIVHQAGNPDPGPVPWNEGALGNAAMNEVWGPWPWWD